MSSETEADVDEEPTDEAPELDEDEIADIGDIADEIEDETAPDDDQDGADDRNDNDDGELDSPTSSSITDGDRTTPGDIYCNGLGMLAAVGRTQYGTASPDGRSDLVDEYGDIARDLEIDSYVDELLEERGGIDELTPAQALLATTMMWGGMVAMDDPEMLDNIAAGKGGSGDA